MKILVGARVKTRIMDVKTNRCVKESPWQDNLVLDIGLDSLAGDGSNMQPSNPPYMDTVVVGSGTTPTSVANGAVTFTQDNGGGLAGTILAASAGFFTAGMVGQLFKWGVGSAGVETYILAYTDPTHVTVDTTALVTVPAVGTVWAVNQTTLVTPLLKMTSYQTNAGDCQTTYAPAQGNQINKRTCIFAPQPLVYNVNEIGYGPALAAAGSKIAGRIVLGATDVVAPTQYYAVIFTFQATVNPHAPTAIGNVGTGINTAGSLMTEGIGDDAMGFVGSNGLAGGIAYLGATASPTLWFSTDPTYVQNPQPLTSVSGGTDFGAAPLNLGAGTWVKKPGVLGTMHLQVNNGIITAGQTLYGIGLGSLSSRIFLDVLFTAPQTAPSGLFQPNTFWECVWQRQLSN
jgi:hypothetical protein